MDGYDATIGMTMDENINDFLVSNMMELSMTFDPLRDFITGEKSKLINNGFSEEASETMCTATWNFVLNSMIEEIKKQGGTK